MTDPQDQKDDRAEVKEVVDTANVSKPTSGEAVKPVPEAVPTPSGPVDFSEAGNLDPSKSDLGTTIKPSTNSQDLSEEATKISNETIEGVPAVPQTELIPQPQTPAQPVPAVDQQKVAADFGVGPNPATVSTGQPVFAGESLSGPFPEELKKWNWGAFFWSWIWGIANNTWIALLSLLGPLSIIMMIILGVKGNEWAWKNRKFANVEDFKKTQHAWAVWGLALFIIGLIIGGIAIVMAVIGASNGTTNIITTP